MLGSLALCLLAPLQLLGQNWSTFLDPSRAVDWSTAGFSIPNYTVACATQLTGANALATGSGAAAGNGTKIRTALASCDATHNVVNVPAGTWYVDYITFGTQGKQVLRGAGPNSTTIIATTGTGCAGGLSAALCMIDSNARYDGSGEVLPPSGTQQCLWTGGLTQGSTTITLSSCGGAPPLNQTIILDQANDTTDTNGVYVCDTNISGCGYEGSTGGNNNGRLISGIVHSQQQVVYTTGVTSLGGGSYTVTLATPVYFTNVRSGKSAGAWWPGFVQNDGVENITLDGSNVNTVVSMYDCYQCWVKGVRSEHGGRNHVDVYQSANDVIRDSYFYAAQGSASESYAIEFEESSAALVENNIFQQVTTPIMFGQGSGHVISYNFNIDVNYSCGGGCPTFGNGAYSSHNAGNEMNLFEGNSFFGIWGDNAWGSSDQNTYFRNILQAYQNGKTSSTMPIMQRSLVRGINMVGNVLGQAGYHTNYQIAATSSSTHSAGSEATSIYSLGLAGIDSCSGATSTVCDPKTVSTLMRWGNYDVVTAGTKWDATEASPAANTYVNANFSSGYFGTLAHTLPASLYYSSTPSWWPSGKNFPPIGPDVSTGNVGTCSGTYSGAQGTSAGQCTGGTLNTAWASHVTSIPAQDCYLSTMSGPPDGSGSALAFDASTCYSATSPTANLTIVSANGTVSGPQCATGSYALGSTVGACTATPNPGYAFAGWSATGASSCTGTGTCGPFSLTTNTTLTASYTPIAATPTFTPGAGTYGASQSVTIATATSGASIYYTTDGSTPTTSSTLYTGPVTVSSSLTLQAIAHNAGYVDSAVGSASYVINGTLSTPTFSPAAGSYTSAQAVTISSGSTVSVIASMTETGNANASTGAAPHRNTYTNCATGYNGSAYTPTGQPVGNKYCTTADQTAGVANGGATQSVVSSTITGTGTSALDNGNGAGGSDSPSSITATYGGTASTGCGVGTNNTSAYVSGLILPGEVANAKAVFGITTQSSPFNTSLLSVTKYNTNGDAGNYLVRQDCASPNTTSVTGEHYEWDDNYNNSAGVYFGFGKHYNFSDSKFYDCPQGCSSWKAMKLCPVGGGACLSTYSWPANNYLYSESYEHYTPGCSYTSGSACAFYDAMCLQLWSGGSPVNTLTCYTLQDATTGLTPSFIPINKSTWTHPQFAPQHQWDVNQGSSTLTATVEFSNLVAYTPASPTLCVTNDGSTPTASSGTCTHGTTYSGPVGVSASATLKAIATQSGFVNSAVGSAAYTINPTIAAPVLIGGQSIISGGVVIQ